MAGREHVKVVELQRPDGSRWWTKPRPESEALIEAEFAMWATSSRWSDFDCHTTCWCVAERSNIETTDERSK